MARIDAEYQRRLESLLAVDEMIAGLVETLAATGSLDNTYIMFTSDNGYHLGEHRIPPRKGTPYDEATRVPLFVRGPGVPASGRVSQLAANIDLAPTFAEIAGIDPPDFVDGRSMIPLLRGDPVRDWREVLLIEDFGGDLAEGRFEGDDVGPPGHGIPPFWSLRAEHLLYVEYLSGEQELYDLRDDPRHWSISRDGPTRAAGASCRAVADLADCKAAMSASGRGAR